MDQNHKNPQDQFQPINIINSLFLEHEVQVEQSRPLDAPMVDNWPLNKSSTGLEGHCQGRLKVYAWYPPNGTDSGYTLALARRHMYEKKIYHR